MKASFFGIGSASYRARATRKQETENGRGITGSGDLSNQNLFRVLDSFFARPIPRVVFSITLDKIDVESNSLSKCRSNSDDHQLCLHCFSNEGVEDF
jgi:hypothetical protein